MTIQHQQLSQGRWQEFSFFKQMANIGSEVERAIKWRNKKDEQYAILAFDRALELIDLTITDNKNRKRLPELTRVRETLIDYFNFGNQYGDSDKSWQDYFYGFAYAAQVMR